MKICNRRFLSTSHSPYLLTSKPQSIAEYQRKVFRDAVDATTSRDKLIVLLDATETLFNDSRTSHYHHQKVEYFNAALDLYNLTKDCYTKNNIDTNETWINTKLKIVEMKHNFAKKEIGPISEQ